MSEQFAIDYELEVEAEAPQFCEACPFKGQAEGLLTGAISANYPVGLRCTGAIGAIQDESGHLSEPIDLPFKGNERSKFLGGGRYPSEYWPDGLNLEVDKEGIIE